MSTDEPKPGQTGPPRRAWGSYLLVCALVAGLVGLSSELIGQESIDARTPTVLTESKERAPADEPADAGTPDRASVPPSEADRVAPRALLPPYAAVEGREPPALVGLEKRRGELHLPLAFGRTKHTFGTRRGPGSRTRIRHTGWTVVAPPKHRVRAVERGRVVIAGPLRGYGNVVVIDHGDDYHSVYAHLKKSLVKVGASVDWGAPIGALGSTSSLAGNGLYFELRKEGRPIDPAGWFASAAKLRDALK